VCKSLENRKSSYEAINARPKVFVVYASFPRVHRDERVANDVFKEWAAVYLTQNKSEGVRVWIAKYDKFVACRGFEEMEFISGRLITYEILITMEKRW
jgi:hypothetical protein